MDSKFGLKIGLVEAVVEDAVEYWVNGPIPHEHSLRGFYGALLTIPDNISIAPVLTDGLGYTEVETRDGVTRYEATSWPGKFLATKQSPNLPPARQGAGSVHHIAFQVETDTELMALGEQIQNLGVDTTGLIDRKYFYSVYFMTPASILFEIATDDIGFTVDEPAAELGENLVLPPQYEPYRQKIEANLIPLTLPRDKK